MHTQPLAPNKTRAQIAIGGFIALIVCYLISYVGTFWVVRMVENRAEKWEIERMIGYLIRFGWVHLAVSAFLMVIFIMWFFRAYLNLKRLGKQLDNGLGLAIGGWFIPVANWIIIWRIYSEIVSSYHLIIKGFPDYRTEKTPAEGEQMVLGGWWWWSYVVLYLIHFWIAILLRVQESWIVYAFVFLGLLNIAPAVLGILMLRKMIRLEGTVYQIWRSGDYTARIEERQMGRMERATGGASWYKSQEEANKQVEKSEDPFQ